MAKQLTTRQAAFVREYLIDGNATAAYIRAGYKDTPSAHANSARLIANDNIAAAIEAGFAKIVSAKELTVERIWKEWRCIALADVGDIIDFTGDEPRLKPANQISEDARRAIASVKVKRYVEGKGDDAKVVEILEFKLWDKAGVLRDAAKAREIFKETVTINGSVEIKAWDAIAAAVADMPDKVEQRIKGLGVGSTNGVNGKH